MSDDANNLAATSEGTAAPPRKKLPVSLLIGIVLLASAGGAGSVWYLMQHGASAEAAHPQEAASAPKYTIPLEGFIVNLADPEETHFLRVTIELGVDRLPEGAPKDRPSSALPIARIRDSILSVLTVCKADPLLTPEGKDQLKKNLLEALNHSVPELGVREVYFSEFLVQR